VGGSVSLPGIQVGESAHSVHSCALFWSLLLSFSNTPCTYATRFIRVLFSGRCSALFPLLPDSQILHARTRHEAPIRAHLGKQRLKLCLDRVEIGRLRLGVTGLNTGAVTVQPLG